jgi:hypothetical protein
MQLGDQQLMKHGIRLLGRAGALLLIAAAGSFLPARAEAAVSGPYLIKNAAYHQCVVAPDRSLNVVLRIGSCNSGFRKWYLERVLVVDDPPLGRLRNVDTGYCAEVNQGTAVPGELVDDWDCNYERSEAWENHLLGWANYRQFKHDAMELCLDTVSGGGSQVIQWTCEPGNDAQLWTLESVG